MPEKIVYLRKANDEVVSHCACADGRVTFPAQMDCPWCGCGWLFSCMTCRRAFTFAKAVELETTWEQLAAEDIRGMWNSEPEADDIKSWVNDMQCLLEHIEVGENYVILDACVVHVECEDVEYEGWHASHHFRKMPQVEALSDSKVIDQTIATREYWDSRAIESDG